MYCNVVFNHLRSFLRVLLALYLCAIKRDTFHPFMFVNYVIKRNIFKFQTWKYNVKSQIDYLHYQKTHWSQTGEKYETLNYSYDNHIYNWSTHIYKLSLKIKTLKHIIMYNNRTMVYLRFILANFVTKHSLIISFIFKWYDSGIYTQELKQIYEKEISIQYTNISLRVFSFLANAFCLFDSDLGPMKIRIN